MTDIDIIEDYEPFLMRERTSEELADYDAGFKAASEGKEWDDTMSFAWRRGWARLKSEIASWLQESLSETLASEEELYC